MSYQHGDEVYSIQGAAGRYVAPVAHGHLVEPIWDDGDGEPHYAQAETWDEVFSVVPEQRFHERIAELNRQTQEAEMELTRLQEQAEEVDLSLKASARLRAAQPQLAQLDLWLSGGCTHLVLTDFHSIEIGTAAEILKRRDDGRMRLVSLFGDRERNYYWSMAEYGDGSGRGTRCILASSEEDARAAAAAWLANEFRRGADSWRHVSLARSAMNLGFTVPDKLRAEVQAEDRKVALDQVARARQEVERVGKLLREAEEHAAAVGAMPA